MDRRGFLQRILSVTGAAVVAKNVKADNLEVLKVGHADKKDIAENKFENEGRFGDLGWISNEAYVQEDNFGQHLDDNQVSYIEEKDFEEYPAWQNPEYNAIFNMAVERWPWLAKPIWIALVSCGKKKGYWREVKWGGYERQECKLGLLNYSEFGGQLVTEKRIGTLGDLGTRPTSYECSLHNMNKLKFPVVNNKEGVTIDAMAIYDSKKGGKRIAIIPLSYRSMGVNIFNNDTIQVSPRELEINLDC